MLLRTVPDRATLVALVLAAFLLPPLTASPAAQERVAPPDDPVPPAMVSRNTKGEVTMRAVRIDQPIDVDGRLSEEVYRTIPAVSGFVQQEPREGDPASEPTDVWVMFDDRNLYVSARCWDSQPERQRASELRRDAQTVNYESVAVVLDTFRDHRNGFFFGTNTLGALRDQSIIGEAPNDDWNTVWDVKVQPFDGGWVAEMVIPFKSLRYSGSGPQIWGINFRRMVTWKNELSFLSKIPIAYGPAVSRSLGSAATLVGVETPGQSVNLEVKPYAVSSVTTDRAAAVPFENDLKAAAGVDLKYGLTRGLIADLTVNTDFAQVEEDLQQVNLTRFSLFFPEKRDFFLEGQGIFGFGGIQFDNRTAIPGNVPVLFFSRRIGLNEGQAVPVRAGGRVTGKVGALTVGALNVQTGDEPAAAALSTNFSVARVKWDLLRRSNIGLIATRRAPTASGVGSNLALGADATFRFFNRLDVNTYYARTDTPGLRGRTDSYRARFDYATDRVGLAAEQLMVGGQFAPEVGFVRRTDFMEQFAQGRFSVRPRRNGVVRKLSWIAGVDYITDADRTVVEDRQTRGQFTLDFQSSDQFTLEYTVDYERLEDPFRIAPGVVVPAGGYDSRTTRVSYNLGQQRRINGRVTAATGTFYEGTKTEVSYNGRMSVSWIPRFVLEPSVALNWVDLPYGDFNAAVISTRFIVTPTPRMLLSSLVQYNALAHSLGSSVRLRWEYTPGSELFVVYSDGRDTAVRGVPAVLNRSFALKLTKLFRF